MWRQAGNNSRGAQTHVEVEAEEKQIYQTDHIAISLAYF